MLILADETATKSFGARLAGLVRGGDAIALIGELGAGKTTLVSGLAEALGACQAHSPTFSLVHEYVGDRLALWHVDLYRIERSAELIELGLDDLVGDRRGIVVVEWADRFPVLPADHLRLELCHVTPDRTEAGVGETSASAPQVTRAIGRSVRASGTGRRGIELAAALDSDALRTIP